MKNVKGFLINPWTATVSSVEISGDYKALYGYLSPSAADVGDEKAAAYKVNCFTVLTLNGAEDTLYLDDDGHLKDGNRAWFWKDYPSPLAGMGLILGTDDEGETVSASDAINLAYVREHAIFGDQETTATFAGAGDLVEPTTGRVYGYTSGKPVTRKVSG